MKILLAPSETKSLGGNREFKLENLSFTNLNSVRGSLIDEYEAILKRANFDELKELFGLKKQEDIQIQIDEYFSNQAKEAILRYTGVAFDYLDYLSLNDKEKEYINNNLLIFSNLYGVVKPNDFILNYKVKQGAKIDSLKPEAIYKEALKDILDKELENEDILDIRAGFYNKFYKPAKFYTTLKFLKNGKVVSHWAKAYRGLVLRYCAINSIETIDEFISMPIEGLSLKEIIESKNSQEIIYEVEQ